jgi:transcriptional regulator with XRE-family HTH domain
MIGERIKKLRAERKITQEELAEKAGINRSYLSVIENNHSSPTLAVLDELARALGVGIWELLPTDGDRHFIYDTAEEYEMCDGLTDFLNDRDEMLLTQPNPAEIDELRKIVFRGSVSPDKRFFRDALLAIRRSKRSDSSKS